VNFGSACSVLVCRLQIYNAEISNSAGAAQNRERSEKLFTSDRECGKNDKVKRRVKIMGRKKVQITGGIKKGNRARGFADHIMSKLHTYDFTMEK